LRVSTTKHNRFPQNSRSAAIDPLPPDPQSGHTPSTNKLSRPEGTLSAALGPPSARTNQRMDSRGGVSPQSFARQDRPILGCRALATRSNGERARVRQHRPELAGVSAPERRSQHHHWALGHKIRPTPLNRSAEQEPFRGLAQNPSPFKHAAVARCSLMLSLHAGNWRLRNDGRSS
jgi:hypothetical protein